MENTTLSRLEQVDLRSFRQTEAGDFTPWLAQEENIALLAEALELGADGLEVEAQEKSVGPFRADILCKDTATGHWVLVENQLEEIYGNKLEWLELSHRKESRILIENKTDPTDKSSWPVQHQWIQEQLENFHRTFSQIIKKLNADDYVPELKESTEATQL